MSGVDIRDPVALFGDISQETLGFVSYEGELNGHMPVEMHFDTENRSLSILFSNGDECPLCADMSDEDIANVSAMYKELHKTPDDEVLMGFYRVDAESNMVKPLYKVPVLMI